MRPALLNEQISIEARLIAHEATRTCKYKDLPNEEASHTPNCNRLKHAIEDLALQVKLAREQPPISMEQDR